jgi:hypothetical protein
MMLVGPSTLVTAGVAGKGFDRGDEKGIRRIERSLPSATTIQSGRENWLDDVAAVPCPGG